MANRDDPLPIEALRDLVGIIRAVAASTNPGERLRLAELAEIELDLIRAIQRGAETKPGTEAHDAAWTLATRAARAFGERVTMVERAAPIVTAAQRRVLGRR